MPAAAAVAPRIPFAEPAHGAPLVADVIARLQIGMGRWIVIFG
jgi:hypothetical protein